MFYCEACGSRRVEGSIWVDLNTGENKGECRDEIFCQGCDSETDVTDNRREAAAARLAFRRERRDEYEREHFGQPGEPRAFFNATT